MENKWAHGTSQDRFESSVLDDNHELEQGTANLCKKKAGKEELLAFKREQEALLEKLENARCRMMDALENTKENFHDPNILQKCLEFDSLQNEYNEFLKKCKKRT